MREREDHVDVASRQKFFLPIRQPTLTRVALTLWAMPVSARVVGDGAISAVGAFVDMATERSRATTFDGGQYFLVAGRQPPVATLGGTPDPPRGLHRPPPRAAGPSILWRGTVWERPR